ncbi:16S rRNA (adenine(1518)-N(6)/adenine(1519)-N(6))-dimethyltransferase RsmA [Pseudogemmatithrix spongiicola]|uniref:Ribosomal RNA small subunit methyltransferase A n=1 Tax=Pseudogemmatithrix spongiicola TaxID=3062599 RepID=A0AA49K099_9BACT|nr:16S rRNA (adenine(1518)-N(6)/adenine(1519)-N(6))-dimethyltransferase RsmA [Gemmatimonadaceae bacterium 'strain 138']WKW15324.1 16S rRNA (adenine(1518)-N(6)/adenine(1519)-N(6))-dimethyltransferase RsmA [Gemmatimonadaceae bacterium 'strain 318']
MSALPRPKKRLGQHFLTDPRLLGRIADALACTREDTVIEIGPGRGALTEHLLQRAGRVIAIELDRELAPILRERWKDEPRFTLIEGDVLEQDLGALAGGPYLLAGNVPYNITTPILFHAMQRPRPTRAVYLVQKEVADRVVAAPDSDDYGALSVNVQALAQAERLFLVGAKSFNPPPKVESAVLRIVPRAEALLAPEEEEPFRLLVQGAFGLRRKQMRRVVRTLFDLDAAAADALLSAAGVDPAARPETLGVLEFLRVLRARR